VRVSVACCKIWKESWTVRSERVAYPLALLAAFALAAPACKQKPHEGVAAELERPPPLAECEALPSKSYCYRDKATKTGTGGLCLFLEDIRERVRCLSDVATATKDRKWCAAADAILPMPDCAIGLARETKDARVCEGIKELDGHDRCVKDAATAAEDASVCRYIATPLAHDVCVNEAASQAQDLRQCAHARNARRRDDCRNSRGFHPPAACELVEDVARREACYVDQLRYAQKDRARISELCEKSGSRMSTCFVRAAHSGEPAYCERVGSRADSPARRACYEVAFSLSVENCNGIPDPKLAQRCSISLRNVSEGTCSAATDPDVADDCWAKLAATSVAACLRIKDTDRRRRCVIQGWPSAKDPRVCAELVVPQLQQQCRTRVRLATPP
jgi:hypothetical protein